MSVAIDPPAQRLGVNAIAHEITPLGLRRRICSHLCCVALFQGLISAESNLEFLGPSKIVTIFHLNTGDCFSRPSVNRLSLQFKA